MYKPDSSTASYIDFVATLEEDCSSLDDNFISSLLETWSSLDEIPLSLEDDRIVLDESSICLLLEEKPLLLDDDLSSLLFDEDDLSETFIISLLEDFSLYVDEDSTYSLLDDCFLVDLTHSSESSLEIVGVEHATRNAEKRNAKESDEVFIFQNIINRQSF